MKQHDLESRMATARRALLEDDGLVFAKLPPLIFMAFHENTDQFRIREGAIEHFDEVAETGHSTMLEWDWELCRNLLGAHLQRDAGRWWLTHIGPSSFDWKW